MRKNGPHPVEPTLLMKGGKKIQRGWNKDDFTISLYSLPSVTVAVPANLLAPFFDAAAF